MLKNTIPFINKEQKIVFFYCFLVLPSFVMLIERKYVEFEIILAQT